MNEPWISLYFLSNHKQTTRFFVYGFRDSRIFIAACGDYPYILLSVEIFVFISCLSWFISSVSMRAIRGFVLKNHMSKLLIS